MSVERRKQCVLLQHGRLEDDMMNPFFLVPQTSSVQNQSLAASLNLVGRKGLCNLFGMADVVPGVMLAQRELVPTAALSDAGGEVASVDNSGVGTAARCDDIEFPAEYRCKTCRYCRTHSWSRSPINPEAFPTWAPLIPWHQGKKFKPAGQICRICVLVTWWMIRDHSLNISICILVQ